MQVLAMPPTAVEPIQVRYTESPVPLTPGTPKEERPILIDFCELYGKNKVNRKGDGDCFFHAVSLSLQYEFDITVSPYQMRERVVDFLLNTPQGKLWREDAFHDFHEKSEAQLAREINIPSKGRVSPERYTSMGNS